MKVALVSGSARADRDGVADYVHRLAAHLPAHGVTAVVAAVGPGADVQLGERWAIRELPTVAARVRAIAADVVHVQFAPSGYGFGPVPGLLPLALGRRTPLVTTLHEYGWWTWPDRLPSAAWRPVERAGWWDRETLTLVPRSKRVLVTNPTHAHAVAQRLGVEPLHVPIGPNVEVAPAGNPTTARAELGVPPHAPLLVFFGFVHPVKGVRYLLDALPRLHATRPDAQLVLAGGFESLALPGQEARDFEQEVRGQIAQLGLQRSVHVTGWLPAARISGLLATADVAVLPFTAGVTTKSGALLAALAHGLPVVATDGGDPALVDRVSALLVPRRDSAALADACVSVLADSGLSAQLKAGATALAARHDWNRIAAAHAQVYEEVAGAGAGAGVGAGAGAGRTRHQNRSLPRA